MDIIFRLSQRIVDEITPPEKTEKIALTFQRVNESIQKLNNLLKTSEIHHHNKQELVSMKGLDWWQKEQFDLHSRFFDKFYSTLSSIQFICFFYQKLKKFIGKKNSNTKFIKNLRSLSTDEKRFLLSLDIVEEARKFRSDYFTHSMIAGSVDWVTINGRVYFLRNPKKNEKTSEMFTGKVVVAIPKESIIYESLLITVKEIYKFLLKGL